jgi:hypothetical protein
MRVPRQISFSLIGFDWCTLPRVVGCSLLEGDFSNASEYSTLEMMLVHDSVKSALGKLFDRASRRFAVLSD